MNQRVPEIARRISAGVRERPVEVSAALLAVGFLAIHLYRVRLFGSGAEHSIVIPAAHGDMAVLGILLVLYGVSAFDATLVKTVRGPGVAWLATLVRGMAVVVLTVYAMDVLAYRFFRTRLYLVDVLEFAGEPEAALSMLRSGIGVLFAKPLWIVVPAVGSLAGVVVTVGVFVLRRGRLAGRWALVVALAGVAMGIASGVPLPRHWYHYGDKILFEDVISRNLAYSGTKPYSSDFVDELLARHREGAVCAEGMGARPTVVLVLVEGLSNYHSNFFSGLNDFTPHLDSIASENRAFTRFHANGWTTRGGLISTLAGRIPIVGPGQGRNAWGSPTLEEFYVDDNVVSVFEEAGYDTRFLTTGDLSFTNKEPWLEFLGFDVLEGHEHAFYDGFERGAFSAAPDSALFERALQVLGTESGNPLFLTLETVSSHQPFSAPDGSPDSESNVIRYVDRQIGWFHRRLTELRGADDVLFIVMGDHRAMTPFTRAELSTLGTAASALVPMVVSWDRLPGARTSDEPAQQIDLLPSVAQVVGSSFCRAEDDGLFLTNEIVTPGLVAQARGEDRDLLYVRVGEEEGLVRFDGDQTRIDAGRFADPGLVLDRVNYRRINRSRAGFSVRVTNPGVDRGAGPTTGRP